VLLGLFVLIAALAAFLMLRARPPRWLELLQQNLHSSAQLPVRVSMFLIVLLVWIAADLGLDVLLGAFAAGMIIRQSSGGEDAEAIRSKLEAIGFGFLVPVFFVASGMAYDIDALFADWRSALLILIYLCGFLLVRGIPVVLYRRFLGSTERAALALFSATQLPLVVVITSIGTESGRMRTLTSAALVGAAMISVLIFPVGGLTLLRRAGDLPPEAEGPEGLAALPFTELEP
jgi:Kef-type K+ transport system membrane component KefB